MGQADDVYIVGPPAEAHAAFEEYFDTIGTKTGCRVRTSKSAVHCRSSLREILETRQRLNLKLMTRKIGDTACPGMVISGIPIGPPTDHAFEQAVHTEIVDRIESDLQKILREPRSTPAAVWSGQLVGARRPTAAAAAATRSMAGRERREATRAGAPGWPAAVTA